MRRGEEGTTNRTARNVRPSWVLMVSRWILRISLSSGSGLEGDEEDEASFSDVTGEGTVTA